MRADGSTGLLDAEAVRAEVNSPTYLAGSWDTDRAAPWSTRPAWPGGWPRPASGWGPDLRAHTRPPASTSDADGVTAADPAWRGCGPGAVVLATNAFPPLVKRLGRYIVPVYDYCW